MIRDLFIKNLSLHVWCILLLLSTAPLLAQATLTGRVVDDQHGEALAEAEVFLEGTSRGAVSGPDGRFAIPEVPAGRYILRAELLGYQSIRMEVQLHAGETMTLELRMEARLVGLNEILVQDDRAYSAASSGAVRRFDIRTRPNRSAQDMLQMAPGLIIAQHAGGGKAEQLFLRGFDADHGTDVAIDVDGIPVNMVSHGHGQGYADLHFLIPEVVEGIDVFKGPYFANYGNLATAGAVSFHTRDHLPENLIRMEGGAFGTARLTTLLQIPGGGEHHNAYIAGQFYRTDGPVDSPQGFERFNLFGKYHLHLSENSRLSLSVGAFSSAWNASGQIPRRAVEQGLIGRFGALDDLEGGTTGRQNFNLIYSVREPRGSEFLIQTYASSYDFKLFSNFTFFLEDSLNGDMIEQTDDRRIFGLNSRYRFTRPLGAGLAVSTFGGGFRSDDAAVALWKSPNRERLKSLVDAGVIERNFFLWLQEELIFSTRLRLQLGLRGDYFTFNVEDHLETGLTDGGLPHASGYRQQSILSPKASLVFSPARSLDLFLNAGSGFHSNDARNVVIGQRIEELGKIFRRQGLNPAEIDAALRERNFDPAQRGVETLPRALGAELGLRTRLGDRLNLGAALWLLDLEREYVYVGDAGSTELSDATRRVGIDLETRLRLRSWLWGDLDVNISRGRSKYMPEGEDNIPLAPTRTATGGLTAIHPAGWEGSLRGRHIGDRPANEDASVSAEGYTVWDLSLGYRAGPVRLQAVVENLFDREWNEAQFDTESRLRGETIPVSELHFTPGNPRNIRLGLSYAF